MTAHASSRLPFYKRGNAAGLLSSKNRFYNKRRFVGPRQSLQLARQRALIVCLCLWVCVIVCGPFSGVHLSVCVCACVSVCWLPALCCVSLPRFTVRDFQYNEEEMKADKEEMTRLSTDKKKQFVRLLFLFIFFTDSTTDWDGKLNVCRRVGMLSYGYVFISYSVCDLNPHGPAAWGNYN